MTRSSSKLLKLTKELDKVFELKVFQAGSRVTAVSSCSGGPTTIFASLNSYVWVVYRLRNHQFGEAKKKHSVSSTNHHIWIVSTLLQPKSHFLVVRSELVDGQKPSTDRNFQTNEYKPLRDMVVAS